MDNVISALIIIGLLFLIGFLVTRKFDREDAENNLCESIVEKTDKQVDLVEFSCDEK